uniref:Macrophage mannose receptor 1-like n=1 Tax=Hirondellea gigas TaxID=1518452 RepID=A0A6A7G2Y8_9CRUS
MFTYALLILLYIGHGAGCKYNWAPFGGWCYYSSAVHDAETKLTFVDAEKQCRAMGAVLVSVQYQGENNFIASTIPARISDRSWIGLMKEGSNGEMRWTDGSQVVFLLTNTYSAAATPDVPATVCYSMDWQFNHKWTLGNCTEKLHFLCKLAMDVNHKNNYVNNCTNCTRRQTRDLTFFRRNLNAGFNQQTLPPHIIHHLGRIHDMFNNNNLNNGNNQREKQDNTFHNPFIRLGPNVIFHVPDHQGGNMHPLNSLFARYDDDRRNLVTEANNEIIYKTTTVNNMQSISDMDYTARLQTTDQQNNEDSTPSKTSQTRVRVRATTAYYDLNVLETGCIKNDDLYYLGSCYSVMQKEIGENDVASLCRSLHLSRVQAFPLTVDDLGENTYLTSQSERLDGPIWLGYNYNNGTYGWPGIKGHGSFTNWAKYEPVQLCVFASITPGRQGLWLTDQCSDRHKILCEYPRVNPPTAIPPIRRSLLFRQFCSPDWTHNPATRSCYKLMIDGGLPQRFAEQTCVQYGGHLVSVNSEQEERFIIGMSQVQNFPYTTIWTGLYLKNQEYLWLDGSASTYLNWKSGQPESHHGRENCVTTYKRTLLLSDNHCDSYFAYMCEAPQGMNVNSPLPPITPPPPAACPGQLGTLGWILHNNSYCYRIYSPIRDRVFPRSWSQARDYCRDQGGDLLSVANHEENSFILSMVYTLPDYVVWIGGFAGREVGFRWSDGSPFTFINWKIGEPNNFQDQESCVSLYPKTEAYWNDDNCGMKIGWICKVTIGGSTTPATTEQPTGHCSAGWVNTGNKCIQLNRTHLKFDDARNSCQGEGPGADLLSIKDFKEQMFAASLIGDLDETVWIGLRYTDTFVWSDQSTVHYTNWAPGEPNNNGEERPARPGSIMRHRIVFTVPIRFRNGWLSGRLSRPPLVLQHQRPKATSNHEPLLRRFRRSIAEDCVEMYSSMMNTKWNDVPCISRKYFICQKPLDPALETSSPPATCAAPYASYISEAGSCYKLVAQPKNWKEADEHCRREGAGLVSIETLTQNAFVYIQALETGISEMWTGFNSLQNPDQYVWSDMFPVLYTYWGESEPNTNDTGSHCVALSISGAGRWFSHSCLDDKPFICKYRENAIATPDTPSDGACPPGDWVDLGGSYCYSYEDKHKYPWRYANAKCTEKSASLVSIHSEDEMGLIAQMTSSSGEFIWNGLIRGEDNEFIWSDGTPYNYMNWYDHEPNSASEKCVEMFLGQRTWNDNDCWAVRAYMCKVLKLPPPSTDAPSASTGATPAYTSVTLSQRQQVSDELGRGGVVGVILACLVLGAAAALMLYSHRTKLRAQLLSLRTPTNSFDNALFNINASQVNPAVQFSNLTVPALEVTDATISLIEEE